MSRTPTSDDHDVLVDLVCVGGIARAAYVLVKRTYAIVERACVRARVEPLLHDLRDPTLRPRLPIGSDFWAHKAATDVVVRGSAFAPDGKPTRSLVATARVGRAVKRVAVFGRRLVEWQVGHVRFAEPEPFVSMPLTRDHAYGGVDPRVVPERLSTALAVGADHPGVYPRNPFGKGYLVHADPVAGAELPNLEDPADLLTPERLVVGDPRRWFEQPLPWCFDEAHPMSFPRCTCLPGVDAWFPAPRDARLAEIRRGLVPGGHPLSPGARRPEAWFAQEGSYGLVLDDLEPGAPVVLQAMHPERAQIAFSLPVAPAIEVLTDARLERAMPRMHSVVLRPADLSVDVVWGAHVRLPRGFIPGVHARIPVAAIVDGGAPLAYRAPPVRARDVQEPPPSGADPRSPT